jgi:carbon storage regulator
MLVLSRKLGEKVVIAGGITITVVSVSGNNVRVAFDAPDRVRIVRSELLNCQVDPEADPDLEQKPSEWKEGASDLSASR